MRNVVLPVDTEFRCEPRRCGRVGYEMSEGRFFGGELTSQVVDLLLPTCGEGVDFVRQCSDSGLQTVVHAAMAWPVDGVSARLRSNVDGGACARGLSWTVVGRRLNLGRKAL